MPRTSPPRLATAAAKIPRRFASIPDAAAYAGVGERTLRRWISEGRITAYRMGSKLLRVDLQEIDDRLAEPIPTAAAAGGAS